MSDPPLSYDRFKGMVTGVFRQRLTQVIGPPDEHQPRVYEDVEFHGLDDRDSGRVIQNLDLRRCSFGGCTLSEGFDPRKRTIVRRIRLSNCRIPLRFGLIGAPILDEVTVEDFRSGQILILWGAAFRRVVLKGRMPSMNFNEKTAIGCITAEHAQRFVEANRKFYQDVDWAIDIAAAEFSSVRLSSIPGQLIRRDPATQILLRRSRLMGREWATLALPAITQIAIEQILDSQHEYQIIVAGKRSKKFAEEMQGIELLRREGFTVE